MTDPRADGDITVVSMPSGFLIGPTDCPDDAPAVTRYVRLVSRIDEAKRVAQRLAVRTGSKAWIKRDDGFATFL